MRIVVLLMALSMCKPITSYAQIGWPHINPTMNGDTVTTAQLWDVYFINENHGFVVGRSTVLETTDGGDTWMHNDLESMLPNGAPLKSICFTDELHGWVAGWYGTVYHTVDGGRTWDDLSLPTQYDFEKVLFIDTKVGWLLGDSSIGTYFGGAGCILGTTDGGLSWDKTFFYPETNDDYRWSFFDIQMVTDQIGYAAGTYGGGAKTTDGGRSWTPLDIPWKVSSWAIHFYDINKGVMSGNRDEVYTQDGGLTWEWSSLPWGHTFDFHFTSDSTGYLVGSGLFQTSDAGATWVQQIVDGQFILSLKAIHFSDKYNGWAVGDHGRIIHTSDGGLVSVQENQMPREIELSISPQPSQVGQAIRMNWSLPQASELSLFFCGSLSDNWTSAGLIAGPALGKIGSANYGIALVFWDDINFDLKGGGVCGLVDKVLIGVTIHELMHLYTYGTGNNHCLNSECLMFVSSDYTARWLPYATSKYPYLCSAHADMLRKYENRSVYNWCSN